MHFSTDSKRKLKALAHELNKVDRRADQLILDMAEHEAEMEVVKYEKNEHDKFIELEHLRTRFDAVDRLIHDAEEDNVSKASLTHSQLNREIETGFQ
jgi:hypothetical protein